MGTINLTKTLQPGTFRFTGRLTGDWHPGRVPIAAVDRDAIMSAVPGTLYRIGRIRPENAFVVEIDQLRLMYVATGYSGYRRAAQRVFKAYEWEVHFDHVLGRALARKLGYRYVLLARANPGVNRSHGGFEKQHAPAAPLPKVCFADRRILDKMIARGPIQRRSDRPPPYDPAGELLMGLTLKNQGRWGYALGVDDGLEPISFLHPMPIA